MPGNKSSARPEERATAPWTHEELEQMFQEAAHGDYPPETDEEKTLLTDKLRPLRARTLAERVKNTARWRSVFSSNPVTSEGEIAAAPYISATQKLPGFRGYSVSAFAGWVMELYGIRSTESSLQRGREGEAQVRASRIPIPTSERWKLIHDGMTLSDLQYKSFQASQLQIDGHSLRANPDLVFRQAQYLDLPSPKECDLVIIEVKCTDAPIPQDLWPNARCQLWSYSKIDEFAFAGEIYLVGEVWNSRGTERRYTRTWRRTNGALEIECAPLFDLYQSTAPRRK